MSSASAKTQLFMDKKQKRKQRREIGAGKPEFPFPEKSLIFMNINSKFVIFNHGGIGVWYMSKEKNLP